MTLQAVPNLFMQLSQPFGYTANANIVITLNATGEMVSAIGQVRLAAGSGTKTISAAGGGKIWWVTGGAVLFGTVGSLFDVGIQDVNLATGFPDGSFDVSRQLIAGTDTIAANNVEMTAMDSGTKTITHGDTVAIVLIFTARSGVDSIIVQRVAIAGDNFNGAGLGSGFPYGTQNTGSPVIVTSFPTLFIEFDDGTFGWIDNSAGIVRDPTNLAYNVDSTPDEYCGVFTPQFRMEINSIGCMLFDVDAGEAFELILYQDPSTSPSVLQSVSPDPEVYGSSATVEARALYAIPPTILEPGVEYGIALRPTTTGNISTEYQSWVVAAAEDAKVTLPFGITTLLMARTGNSGPFSTVQTYHIPKFHFTISALEDGQSSGGGLKLVGTGGLAG